MNDKSNNQQCKYCGQSVEKNRVICDDSDCVSKFFLHQSQKEQLLKIAIPIMAAILSSAINGQDPDRITLPPPVETAQETMTHVQALLAEIDRRLDGI